MPSPVPIADIDPGSLTRDLDGKTPEQKLTAYHEFNDRLAREQRERGDRQSAPPPPYLTVAPLVLTPEREAEIAKLLPSSIAVMTAATLIGLTASEFVAFCKLRGGRH